MPHPDGCFGPHVDANLLCLLSVFGFIPGDVHVLQISSDDVYLIVPWPSRLSLVAPQLPLYSLTSYSGVLLSQYVPQSPQSSFFNDELKFPQPSLPPDLFISHFVSARDS